MIIKKWNYETKKYDEVEISDEWEIESNATISTLEKTINCVNCGCKVRLGSSYKSRVYLDNENKEYYVCGDCMMKEEKEYRKTLPPKKRKLEEIKNKIWWLENKDSLDTNDRALINKLYRDKWQLMEEIKK